MAITMFGSLRLTGTLPRPIRRPGEEVIPGTVNLVLNPSVESAAVGLAGWGGDDVEITRDTAFFFHGAASAACAFPEGDEEEHPSVQIFTMSGLYLQDETLTMIGSVYVLGAFEGLTLALVANYTDASSDTGPEAEIDATDADRWTRPVCSIQPDPEKIVDSFALVVRRAEGAAGGTVWLDAAQVEQAGDWGGVTEFAVGQYGAPYHYWVGAPHLSPSVRDDIPADVTQLGRDGYYVVEGEMYRGNANFDRLENITEHFIGASVTADRDRACAWTMTCKMTLHGYQKLRPFRDWLIPVLKVTDAQGRVRTGWLGHYVVLPSPVTHFEHTGEVDVDCRSVEYLLDRQSFKGKLVVNEGSNLVATARWVLDSAALGIGATGRPRAHIEGNPTQALKKAQKDYEYTSNDSKLTIINELLEDAGNQPVWSTNTGALRSMNTVRKKYNQMQPVRLWAANFDPGNAARDAAARAIAARMPSSSRDVSGIVRRLPSLGDADNQIVVSSVDPRRPKVRAKVSIDDPSNPVSVTWTGRYRTKKVRRRMIPDNATARQMAQAIAQEIGTKIDRVELSVLPDPQTNLLDQIVYLAIYQLDGVPAAVGRYRVLKIEYGFTPGDALMKLTLGFVHGVAELSGGVPVRFYDKRVQAYVEDTGEPLFLSIE